MKHNSSILSCLLVLITLSWACSASKKSVVKNEAQKTTRTDTLGDKKDDPALLASNKPLILPEYQQVVTYERNSGTVSPPYQRHVSIQILPEKVVFSISNFKGEVLIKDSLKLKYERYQEIITDIRRCEVQNAVFIRDSTEGLCTGGRTHKLFLQVNQYPSINTSVYHCANKYYGNLNGEVEKLIKAITDAVPNLEYRIGMTFIRIPQNSLF